jgi:hypothetical protein
LREPIDAPAGTIVSLLSTSASRVSTSRRAALFAAANPAFAFIATSDTAGQASRSRACVPSVDALSTTTVRATRAGGAAASDVRQASRSARVL